MNDRATAKSPLSAQALDQLFRDARSHDVFLPDPVSDMQLRSIYDLAKWGPTTANSQPQRILFLRSEQAKAQLLPALSSSNAKKSMSAPVVAVLAYDLRFFEHLPRMFHDPRARSWYDTTSDHIFMTALRNATLQGAYLMLAARSVGLDCGPMSGFNNAKVDTAFFPEGHWKSNFLCCLGRGDPLHLPARADRFAFDEICRIL